MNHFHHHQNICLAKCKEVNGLEIDQHIRLVIQFHLLFSNNSCILLALPTKSKHPITEVEQQSDEFSSVYTQTTSDTFHSKGMMKCFFD